MARVVLGTATGVCLIAAAEGPLRKRYQVLGNWLAGAGGAVLYLSFWAAAALYDLVPTVLSFVAMAVVTAVCCLLSLRRKAPAIAMLALSGGFATPMLLATGSDRPIALFAYLAVLNGGLLVLCRARKWAIVPIISLGLTACYQLAWITMRMGPERLPLGIAIVLAFALLFALGARPLASEEASEQDVLWRVTRFGGVLVPFVFSLYFAMSAGISDQLWPIAVLLFVLTLGACWLGEREQRPWIGVAAAGSALASIGVWAATHTITAWRSWEVVIVLLTIGALLHVFAERAHQRGKPHTLAIGMFSIGSALALLWPAVEMEGVGPWAFYTYWMIVSALGMRLARIGAPGAVQIASAASLGFGVTLVHQHRALDEGFGPRPLFLIAILGAAALWQVGALVGKDKAARRVADHCAAGIAVWIALHFATIDDGLSLTLVFGALALLIGAVVLSVRRLGVSSWVAASMIATALALVGVHLRGAEDTIMLGAVWAATALFALAPLLVSRALRQQPGVWRVAAMAPVVYFAHLWWLHDSVFGEGSGGALALILAALSGVVALLSRVLGPQQGSDRDAALLWPAVTALGFLTAAAPIELQREWITLAWTLQGGAVLVLWRRFDHLGLKYFGLTLLGAVFVRLALNPFVLDYHMGSGMPVLNWLAYTYLVPVAVLLAAASLFDGLEPERRRKWERELYGSKAVLQGMLAAAAIVLGFVWINLTIIDAFSAGRALEIHFERLAARDLTMSVAWGAYGLLILMIGIRRRSRALRAVGPGLLAITAGKVFLYDLGQLADLWRVASLLGLAVSLIIVSLLYQRFVFADAEPTQ